MGFPESTIPNSHSPQDTALVQSSTLAAYDLYKWNLLDASLVKSAATTLESNSFGCEDLATLPGTSI